MIRTLKPGVLFAAVLAFLAAVPASAADQPGQQPQPAPVAIPSDWTFRISPYAWLPSLNGNQTVRGRTAHIDASFVDVVRTTFDNGGTLFALMFDAEARNGPFGLFGDVVWQRVTLGPSASRSRSLLPGIAGTLSATTDITYNMAIVEAGGAYEFARLGPVGFDIIAGARYWHQNVDLDLTLTGTLDIADLSVTRTRAIAKSGSVDWLDGFVGASARVAVAPGQEIFLRGDLGGGGSRFSWQAIAAYRYDFATRNNVTYSGVIGYRALYVDYGQGAGRNRYAFDMLQHGPVIGLNIRF